MFLSSVRTTIEYFPYCLLFEFEVKYEGSRREARWTMLPSYVLLLLLKVEHVAKLSAPPWHRWHRSLEAIADPHSTSCSNHNKQITIYQQTSPHMGPVSAGQQAGKMAVSCNFFVKGRAFMLPNGKR